MDSLFEKEIMILPSMTDPTSRLAYAGAFALCMDAAAEHAERLGIGTGLFARGLFWLTVKTKVRFFRRPALGETVRFATWPESPEHMRCCRSYRMTKDGETLFAGRTQWAVVDTGTQRLVPVSGVFPEDLDWSREPACPEPFARIADRFEGVTDVRTHRVTTGDIDLGGHMNNAAYVRAIMDTFTVAELSALKLSCVDVTYRAPCFEGEDLTVDRLRTEAGMDLRIRRGEETALLARLEYAGRGAEPSA